MLKTIALESKTMKEFARRAETYNATEATPVNDCEMAFLWIQFGNDALESPRHVTKLQMKAVRCIRQARRDRVSKRQALWGRLISNAEKEVES